jgi:phosphate-selective porin OprO and OprP
MYHLRIFCYLLVIALVVPLTASAGPSLTSDDGKFRGAIGVKLQPQYQWLSVQNQGKAHTFQIRRMELHFKGHAFTDAMTYHFYLEGVGGLDTAASPGNALGGPTLRDAYMNYDFGHGIELKAGQFHVPYNRGELTSSGKLQFVDRGILNETFSHNRDLGVALHGLVWNDNVDYTIAIMNEGTNRNQTNPNKAFLLGARLLLHLMGYQGYSEGDSQDSETPNLAWGVAGNYNKVAGSTVYAATTDLSFLYRGWSFRGEGHLFRNQTTSSSTYGFLGQTGYFLMPRRLELAARFAGVLPQTAGVTKGYETSVAMSYLFFGHGLKVVGDYSYLINSPITLGVGGAAGTNVPAAISTTGGAPGFTQDQKDHRARLLWQLAF